MITLEDIEHARTVVDEFNRRRSAGIRHTPLIGSAGLGRMTRTRLHFKAECLQQTGSFKVRGIVSTLLAEMGEHCLGVMGVSSGNQGLAIAYVARLLAKPSLIVLPPGASAYKAAAIRRHGAEIAQAGFTSYDEAMTNCAELAAARGYCFPNLFANPHFMAGHGTIGLQVLEDLPEVDAIVVPGGSGVLAAGLATACKSVKPAVKVFAVGAQASPCLLTAFRQRRPLVLSELPDTICDGLRSPVVSQLVVDHVLAYLDDIITVTDEEVIEALHLIRSHTGLLVEASSAVTLAALLCGRLPIRAGSNVVCLLTGGNVDPEKALQIATR